MSAYVQSKLEIDIKSKISLLDYARKHLQGGIKKGRTYFFSSPWTSDSNPSFGIDHERGIWNDFTEIGGPRGKSRGDLVRLVMELHNISRSEAMYMLALEAGIEPTQYEELNSFSDNQNKGHDAKQLRTLELNAMVQRFYQHNMKVVHDDTIDDKTTSKAVTYAFSRGFSQETIDEFEMGYADSNFFGIYKFLKAKGFSDEEIKAAGVVSFKNDDAQETRYDVFNSRLMIPVKDSQNNVIGWGGRAVGDDSIKYLNTSTTPVFEKNKVLFRLGQNMPYIRKEHSVLVMEGFLDVVSGWEHDIKNSVASMGTAFSKNHLKELSNKCDTIYLCFDGDFAGRNSTMKAFDHVMELSGQGYKHLDVRAVVLPDGMDPDDYLKTHGKEEFDKLQKVALDHLNFLLFINPVDEHTTIKELSNLKHDFFTKLLKYNYSDFELYYYFKKLAHHTNSEVGIIDKDYSIFSKKESIYHLAHSSIPVLEDPDLPMTPIDKNTHLLEAQDKPEVADGQTMYPETLLDDVIPNSIDDDILKNKQYSVITSDAESIHFIEDYEAKVQEYFNWGIYNKKRDVLENVLLWKAHNPLVPFSSCVWISYVSFGEVTPQKLLSYKFHKEMLEAKMIFENKDIPQQLGWNNSDAFKGITLFKKYFKQNSISRSHWTWEGIVHNKQGDMLDDRGLTNMIASLYHKIKNDGEITRYKEDFVSFERILPNLSYIPKELITHGIEEFKDILSLPVKNTLFQDEIDKFIGGLVNYTNRRKLKEFEVLLDILARTSLDMLTNIKRNTTHLNGDSLDDVIELLNQGGDPYNLLSPTIRAFEKTFNLFMIKAVGPLIENEFNKEPAPPDLIIE